MKQPELEVRVKSLIEVDGLQFKDLNDNGQLDPYEDWRLPAQERARDLVSRMTLEEKAGMMLISSLLTAKGHPEWASEDGITTRHITAEEGKMFGEIPTLDELINNRHVRHFIARDNLPVSDMVEWVNFINEKAEGTRLGIPAIIASNSRNENADEDAAGDKSEGLWSLYPGTLGLAAALKGDLANGGDYSLIDDFAENSRQEWLASGMRKGYMYMLDVVTDPRWQRIYGTFGEDPELIAQIGAHLVKGFQGEELDEDSIALTIKHFPGGGARENGFDPHYVEGKWNVYRTEGSLEKYHLPPFKEAAKHNPSSIMPYYSAPSIEKSHWQEFEGEVIPFEEVGMAFNEYLLQNILRDAMGFEGYINSDTGITGDMDWGVEDLSVPAKFAKAINAGTNLISGTFDTSDIITAVKKGYLAESKLDESNQVLLEEIFKLGLFDEKTYVDAQKSREFVANNQSRQDKAYEAHLKSVTLLKNEGDLPLNGQKLYVENFHREQDLADVYTKRARKDAQHLNLDQVYDYNEAEVAILFLKPVTGDYFSATPGLLELEICEDKMNIATNGDSYLETTVVNLDRYFEIAKTVKANGGQVVTVINITMPWILENIEPISDILVAGYDTVDKAVLEVLIGNHKPTGKLPITLPKNARVIAVNEDGLCYSRNDVPGYDKDKYLPEGVTYTYVDSSGNEYKMDFGLSL